MYTIIWKGDGITKHGSRGKWIPKGTGQHISIGSLQSMYWTFSNPDNGRQASATYGVGRKGEIWQYVDIRRAPWTQGLSDADSYNRATAPIVKANKGVNPNQYLVSIEHEGYYEGYINERGETIVDNLGADGNLTEEQFWASCWLQKFIQTEVMKIYGQTFSLNPITTPGHFTIDPKRKPFCPGPRFPWTRLYAELAIADKMTLEQYEEHITYMKSVPYSKATAYALMLRLTALSQTVGKYKAEADRKLLLLTPCLTDLGYTDTVTAKGIYNWFKSLYDKATAQKWDADTVRLLMIGAKLAKEVGLLA